MGGGPKKKDSLTLKPGTSSSRRKLRNATNHPENSGEVPLQSKSAAEKRRALGEVDPNGCRLSERRDSDLEMLDSVVRERKLRSDGLQQVRQMGSAQVIAIQEIKTASWSTRKWLGGLRKGGHVVFDKPIGTKRGTALILQAGLQIREEGTGGNGRIAWAKIEMGEEVVGLMSLYAPNKRSRRIRFWQEVQSILGDGK
ncbi:hypothetical protein R1sor_003528 [Riccia sorocarpa]|uniref:Uncharacterized protein n=1 Tax=Riccia sorocarpa TaxID=122646 RepID=A0ABD3H3I5_9MARC